MKLRKIILLIATALLIILLHYSVRADWINATFYNETFETEDYLNLSGSSVRIDLNENRHWAKLSTANSIIADEYFDNQINNSIALDWGTSTGQIRISDAYKNGSAGYSAHIFSSIGELYPRKSYSNYPSDNFSVEFDIYMAQQEPVVMELDVGDYISKAQILFGNEANVHKYIGKTTTLSKDILYNTWYSVKLNFSNTAESIYYNNVLLGSLTELQVSNPGAENGIAFNTLGSGTEVNDGIYMDNLRIYTGNSLAYRSSAVLASKLINYSAEIERVSLTYYGGVPSGTEVNCYVKSNVTGENWKLAANNTLAEINPSRGIFYFCNFSTNDITITPIVNNIIIEAVPANVITECSNISSPGKYYLGNNIVNATISKCINISADNVILDCRGYVIDGNNSNYGISVIRSSATATNISIKDCILTDWVYSAIYLQNANNNSIENIVLLNNSNNGIKIYFSSNNTLSQIQINTSSNGINIYGSTNITVVDYSGYHNRECAYIDSSSNITLRNVICAYNIDGIVADSSSFLKVYDSHTSANSNSDISLSSTIGTLIENLLSNNSQYGLYLESDSTAELRNCLITNQSSGAIYVESDARIIVNNSDIRNNTYGIYLDSVYNNSILNTNFFNNGYAIYIASGQNNAIIDSYFLNNTYAVSFDGGSDNKVNSSIIINNEYGVSFDNSNNNTIQDSSITNNTYGITFSVSADNRIFNNVLNNSNNAKFETSHENFWNTSLITSVNIINGASLAGNFWVTPDGTGYSENCTDLNANGICDDSFNISENNVDYLPLAYPDLINPLIIFEVPTTAEGSTTTSTIIANVSVSENNLINITCNLYGSTGVINQTNSTISPFYIEFSGLSVGTYYLNATAIDSYNNSNSTETRTITITTAPLNPVPTGGGTNRGGSSAAIQKKEEEPKIPEQKPIVTKTEKKNVDKTNEATSQSESQQQIAAPQNPLISGAAVQNPNNLQVIPLESGWIGISFAVLILVFIIIRREHERIHSMAKACSIIAKQKIKRVRKK